MLLQSLLHPVPALAVFGAKAEDVGIEQPTAHEAGDQTLHRHVRAGVETLLGIDHAPDRLGIGGDPANPQARGEDLGEGVHADHANVARGEVLEARQVLAAEPQLPVGIVLQDQRAPALRQLDQLQAS